MINKEIEELKKRIGVLEDIEAIRKLRAKYGFLAREGKLEELAALFSEDATGDYPYGKFESKMAFMEFFKNLSPRPVNMSHNPIINVQGERATGEWYYVGAFAGQKNAAILIGKYDEEYVKDEGVWKFRRIKARQIMGPVMKMERQQLPKE